VGFRGGSAKVVHGMGRASGHGLPRAATRYDGLYVGASAHVVLPSASKMPAGLVVFATTAVVNRSVAFGFGSPSDSMIQFFAACTVRLEMDGGFWSLKLQDVNQTIFAPNGSVVSSSLVFGKPTSGQQRVLSPLLSIGSTVIYQKLDS
jgi:hypothetical protein